ncbi:Hypothetical protein R9X50_00753600 [Acrodontium crateriforme]|uniref:Rhodopsin domain-containing protein n=1 Tax=Acrodontium crateriforme TaxID=150365 RepID=A0AAQ3MCH4_9PEZI|nr:Hypothetical protein R9X50_00753600 [Acrodontium crateriforme]
MLSGHSSPAAIYGTAIAFTVVSGIVLIARLLTRFFVARQAGLDDAFISLGWFFSALMGVAICNQAYSGMGVHMWTLTMEDITTMSLWFWAFVWLYYTGLFFTKLSILLQYLRIFPQDGFRRICFIVMALISVWSIWSVFSAIFMCRPVSHFWHSISLNDPQCLPRLNTWYANSAVNIVTDFAIVILPLPMIKKLEVPPRQKMLLMAIFGVGFITCLFSILRLVFIYPIASSADMTWNSPLANIWSAVELNIGILCSCAPTLKGAVQKGFPKLIESLGSLRTSRKDSADSGSSGSTQNSIDKIKLKLDDKHKLTFSSFFQRSMLSARATEKSISRSDYDEEEATGFDGTSPAPIESGIEVVTSFAQTTEMIPDQDSSVSRANSGKWTAPEGPKTVVSSTIAAERSDSWDDAPIPVDQSLFKTLGVVRK